MTAPTPVKPKPTWPRPQLVHQHADLFREPAYENGEPYAEQDDEDDDGEG